MPQSITSAFSEPEDFYAAMCSSGFLSLLVTARSQFRALLTRISLNDISLSAAEEWSPRIAFVAVPADMLLILFPIGNATAPICGGVEMHSGQLVTAGPGAQFHARSGGASHWASIRLPVAGLLKYSVVSTDAACPNSPIVQRWRLPASTYRHVRSLHAAAIRMAARCPRALVDPGAVHGLEQQLLHAIMDCLSGEADGASRAERRGQEDMVRFEQLLRGRHSVKSSMSETCAVLRVSERRLRHLCAEYLGMSPKTYDRLRRMSLVRRGLWHADPASENVSAIARNNGFRDLGRFVFNYRAAFGELPSATLHRSKGLI